MIDSLYIGATGMHAQQINIDVTANNLANINTGGYKRNRVDFEDMLYRNLVSAPGAVSELGDSSSLGTGVAVASSTKEFSNGDYVKTDNALNVAIRGPGFFEVVQPDGSLAYTRAGDFSLNSDGVLTLANGYVLNGNFEVPSDTVQLIIAPDGRLAAQVAGEAEPVDIGQVDLAYFVNAEGLQPMGTNLYVATQQSGDAIHSAPGENGVGTLAQGFQEASNVKLNEEMINLILAQRAYEINSRVVQASDEMLNITNNLRR